jgi:hypothetical protein
MFIMHSIASDDNKPSLAAPPTRSSKVIGTVVMSLSLH